MYKSHGVIHQYGMEFQIQEEIEKCLMFHCREIFNATEFLLKISTLVACCCEVLTFIASKVNLKVIFPKELLQ